MTKQEWAGLACPTCSCVFRVPANHDGAGVVCPGCHYLLQMPRSKSYRLSDGKVSRESHESTLTKSSEVLNPSGGDLEQYVEREGALSWAVVEPLAVQIASALSRIHQSGLLHRDLKPSKVILSAESQTEPQLKLIDFGLEEGAAGFNALTASPEQLRDEDLDERSDLFSFGITLLYLLCGGVPFGNVSAPLMMAQRLDDESYDRLLPDDLSGIGREVISRLIQKDREQRYRSVDEFLSALQTASHAGSNPLSSPNTML